MQKRILILSNQSRSMSIFWRVLIKQLLKKSYEVYCAVPPGDQESEASLLKMGAKIIHYDLDRKGLNPVRDFRTFLQLKKLIRQLKPEILFATTIKPVIYGLMAAKNAGLTGIFPTITGLGYVFEADSPLKKALHVFSSFLYKNSLQAADGIFFQNRDDAQLFRDQGIIGDKSRVLFARGTGVDINFFEAAPFPAFNEIIFLLVARLLEAKGIADYAQASQILQNKGFRIKCCLLGMPEQGRGALSLEQIDAWQNARLIEYLGESRDVREFIANSHVAVLPSWREGTPTSIMEAMSMGRPAIVTDAPGCREVVENGVNGCLVKLRDPDSLALAMQKFIENPNLISEMGKNSRRMAEDFFDAEKVSSGIIAAMEAICTEKKRIRHD